MRTITTSIDIDAAPADVWNTLLGEEMEWNPFLASIGGELREGSTIAVRFRRGMTIRPVVTEVVEGRTLEWFGSIGVRGIFDGRHRFEIHEIDGGSRLTQSETFTGFLVPMIARLLRRTELDFNAMNQALAEEFAPVGS